VDRKKDFPKGTFDLKGAKLNVLICDKISFVGVAHLTRGGRSCSWALYRSPSGQYNQEYTHTPLVCVPDVFGANCVAAYQQKKTFPSGGSKNQ